jgi:chromosome segregation ATPase
VRTVTDAGVLAQREQLRGEADALRLRLTALQSASDAAAQGSAQLASQLEAAQVTIVQRDAQLEASRADVAEVSSLQQQLSERDAALVAAEGAMVARLQESRQWQQLRELLTAKSQEVLALRKRLAMYEPQDVLGA